MAHLCEDVAVKKALYKQWRNLRRTGRFTILQACFRSWATHCPHVQYRVDVAAQAATLQALPGLFKLHDHAVALVVFQLKKASAEVQAAVRQEDADFYQGLADQAAKTYTVLKVCRASGNDCVQCCPRTEPRVHTCPETLMLSFFIMLNSPKQEQRRVQLSTSELVCNGILENSEILFHNFIFHFAICPP